MQQFLKCVKDGTVQYYRSIDEDITYMNCRKHEHIDMTVTRRPS